MEHIRKQVNQLRIDNQSFSFENVLNNLEEAIEDFGVKVFYSDMSGFPVPRKVSGYTRINENGNPEIVVNANEPEGRRRFTMAHELGHIILHWGYPEEELSNDQMTILYRQDSYYNHNQYEYEKEANEFAAQLLAPLDVVERVLVNPVNSFDPQALDFLSSRIAESFNITKSFANVQLEKLGNKQNG